MSKQPSHREQLQQRIYEWLLDRINTFTAPYGVLSGLHTPKSGHGKVRTITFGCARTLDACLYIWSTTNLYLETNRETVQFTSEHEFYGYCIEKYGARPNMTDEERAFRAGFSAGCDHMQSPVGPGRYAKDVNEAYQFYKEQR